MGRTAEQRQLAAEGKRKCILCNDVKPIEQFNVKRHHYHKDGSIKYTTHDSRCKTCLTDYQRKMRTRSVDVYCRTLIRQLKHRPKVQDIPFDLSDTDLIDVWNKQEGKCFYTGYPLDLTLTKQERNAPHILYPSIDKQIPELGYVTGNVVWCVYAVNRLKNDLSHDKFVKLCSIVVNRFS